MQSHSHNEIYAEIASVQPVEIPNKVVPNAVGCRNTQMSTKERKRKSAKERKERKKAKRKRAQKSAKERFRVKIANNQV